MRLWPLALALGLLAGCAGFDGRSLVPGQSTADEVEKLMGPSQEKRAGANGETVLWYPRQPYGRVSYAARIGSDGKLVAVEQRLTKENLDKLRLGVARESDVRDLLGPPWRADPFPRQQREVWTYQAMAMGPQIMVVQFSNDGVLRESFMIDNPEYQNQQSSE